MSFGLPRAFPREGFAAFPDAGFHRQVVQLTFQGCCATC